ncbi:MAG: hypothetical protein WD672_01705 [Woeseia sp.]
MAIDFVDIAGRGGTKTALKKLTALTNEDSVEDGVRLLAEALLDLNHKLAEAEKAKIRTLTLH